MTARGNRRQPIFLHDADPNVFIGLVDQVVAERQWRLLGYCLMPNHYHLVVRTPRADLSSGMHRLNSRYAHWFNWRHELEGHLFQGRFHAVLLRSTWHLLELSRYLAMNPVHAGLCRHPSDWGWSSYGAVMGRHPSPRSLAVDEVLLQFASEPDDARRAFESFVQDRPARRLAS